MSNESRLRIRRTLLLCAVGLLTFFTFRGQAAQQRLLLSGSTGSGYTIEGSNDLETWEVIRTVENLTGALEIPYSELGDHSYHRVSHAGADDLRAVGLAIFQAEGDAARREELRLAARDQALAAIATNHTQFSTEQVHELFASFATQEAFNAAIAAADAAAVSTNSQESVDRILGVLENHSSTMSANDLDSIRALALSTGLASGVASSGGSLNDVLALVSDATQNLDPTAQQAAIEYAQVATSATTLSQLLGGDGSDLLQDALSAVSAAISSGSVSDLFNSLSGASAATATGSDPAVVAAGDR